MNSEPFALSFDWWEPGKITTARGAVELSENGVRVLGRYWTDARFIAWLKRFKMYQRRYARGAK